MAKSENAKQRKRGGKRRESKGGVHSRKGIIIPVSRSERGL